jgi:hypothetical protein
MLTSNLPEADASDLFICPATCPHYDLRQQTPLVPAPSLSKLKEALDRRHRARAPTTIVVQLWTLSPSILYWF